MTNKIKRHKKKLIIGTCIIVIGIGVLGANSRIFKEKMQYKINEIYYSKFEAKEYTDQFIETDYKNYKYFIK